MRTQVSTHKHTAPPDKVRCGLGTPCGGAPQCPKEENPTPKLCGAGLRLATSTGRWPGREPVAPVGLSPRDKESEATILAERQRQRHGADADVVRAEVPLG